MIDGNRQANIIDAGLRMLIGAISAAALFLLVDVQLGAAKFVGTDASWQATLLVGFMAGFFERLVPDLSEKAPVSSSQPRQLQFSFIEPNL